MNMNRLIEFRGKRLDNGEWVYGAYTPDYTLEDPNEAGWINDNEYGIHHSVDPKTVGQAFAINDTKYFEGDLLGWRGHTLRVVFNNGMLLAVHEDGAFQPMSIWRGLDEAFVIGTVYDNKGED